MKENKQETQHFKAHSKVFLALPILFFILILTSFVSAEFLSIKSDLSITKDKALIIGTDSLEYNKIWETYKPILIKDVVGLGADILKGAITSHTDTCGNDVSCLDEFTIQTFNEGSLIEDIKFYTLSEDGDTFRNKVEQSIRSYSLSYWGNVIDYETQCKDLEKVYDEKNGTYYTPQECVQKEIGSHNDWIEFKIGDKFNAGTYQIKLEGTKKPTREVDWVIKTQGKTLDEWAVWGAYGIDLTNGLVAQYKLNDNTTTTNVIDTTGINNGTLTGAGNTSGSSVTGKINGAITFDGVNDYITIPDANSLDPTNAMTLSFWINLKNLASEKNSDLFPLEKHASGDTGWYTYFSKTTDKFIVRLGNDALSTSLPIIKENWTNLIYSWNGTFSIIYVNGNYDNSGNVSPYTPSSEVLGIGGGNVATTPAGLINGSLDDIRIYNRSLSPDEITALYNGGLGTEEIKSAGVQLNSPADGSTQYTNPVTLNASANVTGGAYLVNMSLYDNSTGSWGLRNTTTLNAMLNANQSIYSPMGAASGSVTIGYGNMFVTNNYAGLQLVSVRKDASNTGTKAKVYSSGGTLLATGTFNGAIATFASPLNLTANTKYRIIIDKDGAAYSGLVNNSATFPNNLAYLNWTGGTTSNTDDTPNARFVVSVNINIFSTIYAQTQTWGNTYSTGSTIKWNVQACDSDNTCGWATSNRTFYTIYFDENSYSYNNNTYETNTTNFFVNLTKPTGYNLIQVYLNYNGTDHVVSNISEGSNYVILNKEFSIPVNGNAYTQQNNSFYWKANITDGVTPAVINTSTKVQTVNPLILTLCNATYPVKTLNFSIYNEEAQTTLVNATFDSAFNYWIGDGSIVKNYYYQNLNVNTPNYTFCLSPNTTIQTNMQSAYTNPLFYPRTYFITNGNLTNSISNIKLLMLNTTTGVKFYFTLEKNGIRVSNATVTITKKNIGTGAYDTVGIRQADSIGEFIEYLELDKEHVYSIVQDGTFLGSITKTSSCSATPCLTTLSLDTGTGNSIWDGYYDVMAQNVIYTLEYNPTTKIINYTFFDTTGLANYFRLQVDKIAYDNSTGTNLCNTTLYATQGTITCNVTGETGSFIAKGVVSRSPERIVGIITGILSSIAEVIGQQEGLFYAMMFIILIGIAGAYNPVVGIVLTTVGFFFATVIGLISVSITAVVLVVILAIILIVKNGRYNV